MESLGSQWSLLAADSAYRGTNGFIPGSRGSLMLDVVFLAMFVVVPVLGWSIYCARYRRHYALHKKLQIATALVLLLAVTLFEIDIRLHGWTDRAEPSPYFDAAHKWRSPVGIALLVHLACAVPTLLLWIAVVVQALRKFPRPAQPAPHSAWHRRMGTIAAIGMAMTAVTGWLFYWLAFVAA